MTSRLPGGWTAGLCLVVLAAHGAPASAHWTAAGSGAGSGPAATMPTGEQPAAAPAGQSVTVAWVQSTFVDGLVGAAPGGGYVLTRYAAGSGTRVTPNAACAGAISGATPTLECVEADVPYGDWQYTVKPVLGTFTGGEGARSTTVRVAPAAPTLESAAAQNPAPGQVTGAIELSWSPVADATGYNVYRRAGGEPYDFDAPLSGGTPQPGTSFTDPGAGLTEGTPYRYVVRAVAGPTQLESASSDELTATPITRPAPPAGSPAAAATAGGAVDVSWPAVPGVAGYNLYRRTSSGAYDLSAPLNGATPIATTSYRDATAVNGTTYVYTVRSAIIGAGGAQVESAGSGESAPVTSDGTPPPAPSGVTVTSGGAVLGTARCGLAAGTRFINAAGRGAVSLTATIAAPDAGETVVFSAATPGSAPVTVTAAATGTSVTATLDLGTLLDGTVTVTARTRDAAGNLSATTAPVNAIVKDVVPAALGGLTYTDNALAADALGGTSECGATITAVKTAGANVGRTFPTSGTFTVGAAGTFSGFTVDPATLSAYGYNVTATDLAGNPSAPVAITGTAVL